MEHFADLSVVAAKVEYRSLANWELGEVVPSSTLLKKRRVGQSAGYESSEPVGERFGDFSPEISAHAETWQLGLLSGHEPREPDQRSSVDLLAISRHTSPHDLVSCGRLGLTAPSCRSALKVFQPVCSRTRLDWMLIDGAAGELLVEHLRRAGLVLGVGD